MFTNSMKKIVLGLGLAAVTFASGSAMANEFANYQPNPTVYYSNPHDDGSSLLDRVNRSPAVGYHNVR